MKPTILSTLLVLAVLTPLYAAPSIAVSDAWVREPPPAQEVAGGFLTIVNHGHDEDALIGAENDASRVTELHKISNEGGVMKMRRVEKIVVPAGGTTKLAPGGFHLMLIDLKHPLKSGDQVHFTLRFRSGSVISVTAVVRIPDNASR